MAYNTKAIVTDVDGNPISQYYNPTTDSYEPVVGSGGGNAVVLYNENGTENNSLSLIPILDKLSQLTGTVIDEETRKSNELQRIAFYNLLQQMLADGELKGEQGIQGIQGETGKGLEFNWSGTSLGVRIEGEIDYIYVNLKGETGNMDNLTAQHILSALGYTPVKSVNNELPDANGNIDIDVDFSDIENRIDDLETNLQNHEEMKIYSESGTHGFRVKMIDGEYISQVEINDEWVDVSGGGGTKQIPIGNVVNFTAEGGDGVVILKWTDPEDISVNGLVVSQWKGTKILRKVGSYPANENDGTLVVDSGVRNQYEINGFEDIGLENDIEYFYMAFPYNMDSVITVDIENRVSATPTGKDDSSGSPGSPFLIAGTMQQGYFGEVPASEIITGDSLASQVGISQGTSQFSTTSWLKFALDGKILFVAKKPIRHTISWDNINTANCVYGDKTVSVSGKTYKVRLFKGALTDPSRYDLPDRGAMGSEWNRLMLPIHIQAKDKSWAYPAYVESDIPYWGVDFTDEDLLTHNSFGNGSYSWCQEVSNDNPSNRVDRGGNGVSHSGRGTSSGAGTNGGWRPVLELVP